MDSLSVFFVRVQLNCSPFMDFLLQQHTVDGMDAWRIEYASLCERTWKRINFSVVQVNYNHSDIGFFMLPKCISQSILWHKHTHESQHAGNLLNNNNMQ